MESLGKLLLEGAMLASRGIEGRRLRVTAFFRMSREMRNNNRNLIKGLDEHEMCSHLKGECGEKRRFVIE